MQCAGAWAVFDTVDSPVTQTFGLGVFEELTSEALDTIERFFLDRGAPVFHEVSPFAGVAALDLLCARNYKPVEISSVLFRTVLYPNVERPPGSQRTGVIRTRDSSGGSAALERNQRARLGARPSGTPRGSARIRSDDCGARAKPLFSGRSGWATGRGRRPLRPRRSGVVRRSRYGAGTAPPWLAGCAAGRTNALRIRPGLRSRHDGG